MDYRYDGKFKPEETENAEYRPNKKERYYYCDIYPGIDNDSTECTEYGKQTIRVRIIPYSVDSVLLTGWNGIFDILPFNDKYALLDNASCDEKPWRTALISLSDISKCFLSIKER